MHPKASIEPVTVLKTKSAELIRRTQETGQPVIITQNGRATTPGPRFGSRRRLLIRESPADPRP